MPIIRLNCLVKYALSSNPTDIATLLIEKFVYVNNSLAFCMRMCKSSCSGLKPYLFLHNELYV